MGRQPPGREFFSSIMSAVNARPAPRDHTHYRYRWARMVQSNCHPRTAIDDRAAVLRAIITLALLSLATVAQKPPPIGVINTPAGSLSIVPPGWQEAQLIDAEVESVPYSYNGRAVQIELPFDNQGGAAATVMIPPFGTGEGADNDRDGIIDSREGDLAERFAPIILHDKDDLDLPTEVDWLLSRTSLEYYNNNGLFHRDDHIHRVGPPVSQLGLIGLIGTYAGGVVHSDGTRSRSRQHTFALLDVPPGDRQGSLNTLNWKTYTHVFRNYYGGVSIQYWRCYAFNTGDQTTHLPVEIDHHGGDWEAVEVVLGKDLLPIQYRLLGHSGIDERPPSQVSMEGTHVKVFSEPGGHASHLSCVPSDTINADGFPYRIWLNDLNQVSNQIRQETWSQGSITWPTSSWRGHTGGITTPSGGLINIGEKTSPLNGQVFVKYSGLWGSLGDMFSGYWGPAFNETDMAPDNLITAWCYGMKASRSNIDRLHQECYPDGISE